MALVKCKDHRPIGNYSRTHYLPSGDGDALVCGSKDPWCKARGLVWLRDDEEHDYRDKNERIFTVGPPSHRGGKVRVGGVG